MVFFRDPLPYRNPSMDMQGLSDWHLAYVPAAKVEKVFHCASLAIRLVYCRQHYQPLVALTQALAIAMTRDVDLAILGIPTSCWMSSPFLCLDCGLRVLFCVQERFTGTCTVCKFLSLESFCCMCRGMRSCSLLLCVLCLAYN